MEAFKTDTVNLSSEHLDDRVYPKGKAEIARSAIVEIIKNMEYAMRQKPGQIHVAHGINPLVYGP
jgi:hypothetical protein